MSDQALAHLCDELADSSGDKLLIADEHLTSELLLRLKAIPKLCILTNRFDVFSAAQQNNIPCLFNDMDIAACQQRFDLIVYRLSKEKAIVHHIINQVPKHLNTQGAFILCGHKNEGFKTYVSKLEAFFGSKASKSKGEHQLKLARATPEELGAALDDRNYDETVPIGQISDITIFSKPGQFGWNKLDQGSQILANVVATFIKERAAAPLSMLDLGCGYGLLSIYGWIWGIKEIVATDNNAAAVHSCQYNFNQNQIDAQVIADDCATSIHHQYELVICNPPFHKGFNTNSDLTEKFLKSASNHLKNKGTAFFVVNQFIAVEKLAAPYFQSIELVYRDQSFKVARLSA